MFCSVASDLLKSCSTTGVILPFSVFTCIKLPNSSILSRRPYNFSAKIHPSPPGGNNLPAKLIKYFGPATKQLIDLCPMKY